MLFLDATFGLNDTKYISPPDHIVIDEYSTARQLGGISSAPVKQRRKYFRYTRDDIQAYIADQRFLFGRKYDPVRLLNVSQVGVSINYEKKLRRGLRMLLQLEFDDGHSFEFKCVIVYRRFAEVGMIYGLNFGKLNRDYEDHLLKTGLRRKLNNLSNS